MFGKLRLMWIVLGTSLLITGLAAGADIDGSAPGIPDVIKEPPPLPKEFAFTFSLPYGLGDEFPREPEEFDRMLGLLKGAGFNTVHCPYTDWRVDLFKKHGMKMMVDVLAWKPPVEADVRRPEQRPKVKEMCEKMRGNDAIWGYNLWNERLDWCGSFDFLDAWIRMLRTWDPTHPVWVGTYRYLYSEHFKSEPGVHAWYDYHWDRGFGWNLKMLNFYRGIAAKRHGSMGKWLLVMDYNRNLYTLNTSIAHGVKTVIWFIGGPYAAREPDKTKRWHEDHHFVRIGRHMQPLYKLIGQMGLPYAVYSTPTRRNELNHDKPLGLLADTTAFPPDFWLQVKQGEVICGMFKLPDGSDVAYVANHNAWAWQGLVLEVQQKETPIVVSQFDRGKGDWVKLGAKTLVNLSVAPADAIVLRFEQDKTAQVTEDQPVGMTPTQHFAEVGTMLKQMGVLADGRNQPYAVYSTPTLRTPDNKDKEPGLPEGGRPFPDNLWLKVKQGEAACAFFKLKDGSDVVCVANHNKIAWQGILVDIAQSAGNQITLSQFDKDNRTWTVLGPWEDVNFALGPGERELFRFEGAGEPEDIPLPPPVQQSSWTGVDRIVAVGDVHGDYGQFLKALKAAKVIDDGRNWVGGKTHLVQCGDVVDRGAGSRDTMDLLMKLETQAPKAGGMVHPLLGNHEIMVLQGDFRDTDPGEHNAYGGADGYRKALSPEGKYGQWLRNHNTVIRINNVLFLHGGLMPNWADLPLDEMNSEIRKALQKLPNKHGAGLIGRNGPTWYRGWPDANAAAVAAQCAPVFQKLEVRHAVIGHTPQKTITVFGEGRVLAIDSAMTAKFGGPASALVIEKGKFYAVYPGQNPALLDVDYEKEKAAAKKAA